MKATHKDARISEFTANELWELYESKRVVYQVEYVRLAFRKEGYGENQTAKYWSVYLVEWGAR
jgi:hypothetical protein